MQSEQKGCCSFKSYGREAFLWYKLSLNSTFGDKKHWLLVVEDSSDYVWSFFLKEKPDLADTMLGLVKNLKTKYNLQVQYLCCDNAYENVVFEEAYKQERL